MSKRNPFKAIGKPYRAGAITLLRRARQKIVNGDSLYVCSALSNSVKVGDNPQIQRACAKLRSVIEDAIAPYGYVTSWVQSNYPNAIHRTDYTLYRCAWIDEMIAQLEALQ